MCGLLYHTDEAPPDQLGYCSPVNTKGRSHLDFGEISVFQRVVRTSTEIPPQVGMTPSLMMQSVTQ